MQQIIQYCKQIGSIFSLIGTKSSLLRKNNILELNSIILLTELKIFL